MDIKFSISVLTSAAYFFTLMIFKTLHSKNINKILLEAGGASLIVFILVYTFILYVFSALESTKRQDARKSLEYIKKLEQMEREQKTSNLDEKMKQLQNNESKEDEDMIDVVEEMKNTEEYKKQDSKEIEQMKKEAGTQFNAKYIQENDLPII